MLVATATALGCGSPDSEPPVPAAQPSPRIAVIVLENHGFGEVVGNPEAPFLNGLARRGALATRYFGVAHPSLPNYLAMLGGSTFGIEENCTGCSAWGDNLAAQLSRAGLSWRAYMEDMPEACFTEDEEGEYVKRHNPFVYFPSIRDAPGRCENVVPMTALDDDLERGSLPAFAWIGPDLCHDAHDCELELADRWLAETVPGVTAALGRGGFLVVTFDEASDDDRRGCCGRPGGGRVATVLAGPAVERGARLNSPLDHYSLLATIEDSFDLPRLRNARGAASLGRALAAGAG